MNLDVALPLKTSEFDMERLLVAWQDAVFELYQADPSQELTYVDIDTLLANF